jgi:hypothetical protein
VRIAKIAGEKLDSALTQVSLVGTFVVGPALQHALFLRDCIIVHTRSASVNHRTAETVQSTAILKAIVAVTSMSE